MVRRDCPQPGLACGAAGPLGPLDAHGGCVTGAGVHRARAQPQPQHWRGALRCTVPLGLKRARLCSASPRLPCSPRNTIHYERAHASGRESIEIVRLSLGAGLQAAMPPSMHLCPSMRPCPSMRLHPCRWAPTWTRPPSSDTSPTWPGATRRWAAWGLARGDGSRTRGWALLALLNGPGKGGVEEETHGD